MTVQHFCLHNTQVGELCIIRDCGYIIESVWIDIEDIFSISEYCKNKEVEHDEWGYLYITNENGTKTKVQVHYIDI